MNNSSDLMRVLILTTEDGFVVSVATDSFSKRRENYWPDFEHLEELVLDLVEMPKEMYATLGYLGYTFDWRIEFPMVEVPEIDHDVILRDGYDANNWIYSQATLIEESVQLWGE